MKLIIRSLLRKIGKVIIKMSLCKRIIARLDIKGNMLIKGVRFEGLRVIGESANFAKKALAITNDELVSERDLVSEYL